MFDNSSSRTSRPTASERRLRLEPSAAQDLGEGPFELSAGAGVDEWVDAAVAVAQPKAAGEERLRDDTPRADGFCESQKQDLQLINMFMSGNFIA